MEEFDYLKIEAGNKLCVAELINVILSCNHQAMNILLVEYFEKDHAPYEVLKMDKMPFFTLITDPKLVKYINNQFELLDEAFLEVEKLELLKKEILEFKPEDPAYKSKCQELRDHCTNQRFTLQDFRYQEQFKTAFEKLVKDLKELEAANYDEKKKNREKVRGFKDGIARFKTRLANLYCKRLELDHKMYSFANLSLALQCETLKSYFAEYLEKIKFQNFFDIDLRTKVCQFYQDTKDVEEYYPYSPHWPPFKDFIATDKFKRQKMQASFIRLLKAIELALNSTLQIDIQNYFKLIETVLTKIEKMVGFMMARLKTVTFADKHIDVHRYTAACIHHFYALLKKLANIYQEICSGHLKRYFTNFDITSKKQAVEAKKEIISELKARLDSQPEAYFTLEFWNNLSLQTYHVLQHIYDQREEKTYVDALTSTFRLASKQMEEVVATINQFQRDLECIMDQVQEDNKLYEEYLQTKYMDARSKVYDLYKVHKFEELFKIDPVNNFTRVRFPHLNEEYFLNIPSYFMKKLEQNEAPKRPKFEFVKFPHEEAKGKGKPAVEEPVIEDESLKNELDREFKYFTPSPEEIKWQQIHTKFFDKLNMEQFLNLFIRARNLLYKGKHYDYMDQIVLTKDEGASILKDKTAVVSSLEDIMKKGRGYAKYSLKSRRKLPFPIPFTDGAVTSDSTISCFLLSNKHLVNLVKNSSNGIPTADSFLVLVATDVSEQTNGVEVKWSCALQWLKSSFLKSILESKVPDEAKKNIEEWVEAAEEVLRQNKPEVEIERPKLPEEETVKIDFTNNPVFFKQVEELNSQQDATDDRFDEPTDFYKSRYCFDTAKDITVHNIVKNVIRPEHISDWHVIKKHSPFEEEDVDRSFQGQENEDDVNELDDTQRSTAYITLAFLALSILYRMLFVR